MRYHASEKLDIIHGRELAPVGAVRESRTEHPHENRQQRKRDSLWGLRAPHVTGMRRQVTYFCAVQWPGFGPPLIWSVEAARKLLRAFLT